MQNNYKFLSIALAVVVVALVVRLGFMYSELSGYQVINNKSSLADDVSVGKVCDYKGGESLDTHGLQCYFFGDTVPRQGVWIKPVAPSRATGLYANYLSGWQNYSSPDGSVSFQKHRSWFVDDNNWSVARILSVNFGTKQDYAPFLNVEEVSANGVSVNDRIAQITDAASSVTRDDSKVRNMTVTRLYVFPKTSLGEIRIYSIYQKSNGDYVLLSAPEYNNPLYDFPIEYMLSTVRVK